MNTLQTIVAATFGFALATSAVAVDFTDTAPVISATPQYRQVSAPRQECWTENVSVQLPPSERSNTGAIIGGVTGGIVGNQVGGGRGKDAATVAGAIVGTIIGERLDNPQQPPQFATQQVQHCRVVNDTIQELSGYAVIYRYGGRDVTVTLPYNPGSTVRVGVGVM